MTPVDVLVASLATEGQFTGEEYPLRILTYNVQHGQAAVGVISLKRIARVIAAVDADVIVLNEVLEWPGVFSQPDRIASLVDASALFQRNVGYGPMGYGNAILWRHPTEPHADIQLPEGREQRGCLVAEIDFHGRAVLVAATHLALGKQARAQQIEALVRELPRDRPLVLAGDMNCPPSELEPLHEFLSPLDTPHPTYPSLRPTKAFDQILYSSEWTLVQSGTIRSLASDHLPLFADLELKALSDS